MSSDDEAPQAQAEHDPQFESANAGAVSACSLNAACPTYAPLVGARAWRRMLRANHAPLLPPAAAIAPTCC